MGSKTVLVNREDIRSVEAEEQFSFVISTLLDLGIPEELLEPCIPKENEEFTVDQKIKLRKVCKDFRVSIVDDLDGGVMIYVSQEQEAPTLVAEWKKCKFVLRTDPAALERANRTYAEVHAEWWTIFEEETQ